MNTETVIQAASDAAATPPTAALMVAVVGYPNAGKTSLFNALTGTRQKVGNYPGVTVERKAGPYALPSGAMVELVDLPGCYSLTPRSPDEAVTRDTLLGVQPGERTPTALLIVADATNLPAHLRFALELKRLGIPAVMALNRVDMAVRDGLKLDVPALAAMLAIPVIETVAVRKRGLDALALALEETLETPHTASLPPADPRSLSREARALAKSITLAEGESRKATRALDRIALHPVIGPILLAAILFCMFQAVFSWAEAPMGWIESGIAWLQSLAAGSLPPGFLKSLIIDGLLAGVGSVIVFLPQILILFAFILLLEGSGYMVRAAFLVDKLMARVGLNGGAFIPLLSSFACAIPGIMATRTIADPKDRLTTILIAPLMTCSARLPVYAVIIAAFIPATRIWGPIGLQGLVMFALYAFGILGAMAAAWALRRTVTKGPAPTFLMEMPAWQWPSLRDTAVGLWLRCAAFLKRAGTIIMGVTIALWLLASYPKPPEGATAPAIDYSIAGRIGIALEPIFRPIGFNREISIALIPGMAAREVAVSALGTVYSLQATPDEPGGLVERLRTSWSLPTALAFLAWFVFAPQCLSTLAVARRETNSWRWPAFMFAYLFAMAYIFAGLTYWTAKALLQAG